MSDANEADILFPDRQLTLAGEEITVHEFKYLEGLQAAAIAQPLLNDLLVLVNTGDSLTLPGLDAIIGNHAGAWTQLLAMSANKTAEWVSGLNDQDGTLLSMTFWEINGPFLLRRVAFAKRFGTIVLNPPPVAS